ncbi:MAG: peptidase S1 and S6 chymotrypsin/Hap [Parcubacteria group bacterium Gr01-1014_8]|nr:MAG: peptidase S1 and S6 chymotrypsin/Hap [Parcubacteria group bacterium Gr01-1014_8]
MDIERLNKSQIVLLTLLVSFVTSIATGIVTVSLMDQAPPSIAQTVNRVVERTVEKMVPSGQAASAAVTTEKTVVVKESDLIVRAVESISPSVVRLYATGLDAPGDNDKEVFLGLGVIIAESGTIVTDAAVLPASGSVEIALSTGTRIPVSFVSSDALSGIALLQGATSTAEGPVSWKAATLSADKPALGTSVIAISGRGATRIADGIITALPAAEAKDEEAILETSIPSSSIAYGSPLVNSSGEIEGISTGASRLVSEGSFLASLSVIMYTTKTKAADEDEKAEQQ